MSKQLTIEEWQKLSFQEVEERVTNEIYYASLIFERLEDAGLIRGNGHHIAQAMSEAAKKELEERWRKDKDGKDTK